MSDEIQNTEINEDNISKVLAGEENYSILTEAELDIAADRQMEAELNQSNNTEEKAETEQAPEPPKEEERAETEEETNIIPLDQNERLRKALEEKHRFEQLYNDREDRITKAKEDPTLAEKLLGLKAEVVVDPEKDYLADENLARMESKLIALEQWKTDREKRDATRDAEVAHTQEKLGVFGEINQLQAEHASLKTTKSFQSIDETFRNWQTNAMASKVDVDRFLSDESYRKQAEAQGHTLNVSKGDLDAALKIWDLNSKYNAEKKQGYNTSLSHVFTKSPMYEDSVRARYSTPQDSDDNAIANKLREREAEVSIMSPGSNAGETGTEEALKTAILGMEALSMKTHMTASDEKQWNDYQKIVDRYDNY